MNVNRHIFCLKFTLCLQFYIQLGVLSFLSSDEPSLARMYLPHWHKISTIVHTLKRETCLIFSFVESIHCIIDIVLKGAVIRFGGQILA